MQSDNHGPATEVGSGRLRHHEQVNVITQARPSYDDEFRSRRKRYIIMMATRIPCLVIGALLYHTPWLAILVILISIPLPWMAVLIANDGPARKKDRTAPGLVNTQVAITSGDTTVVEPGEAPGDQPAAEAHPDQHRPDENAASA